MRRLLYIFTILCCTFFSAQAQKQTEGELVQAIIHTLQQKDSKTYIDLFPGLDSMAAWILKYADQNSEARERVLRIYGNEYARLDFDSVVHKEAQKGFQDFIQRAKLAGIHWDHSVLVRYELEKLRRGRGLLTEKIAPVRFLGYIFVKDLLTRKVFALTVFDIMQVEGLWYGGELSNIFEANTKEEFEEKLLLDRKKQREKELGIVRSDNTNKAYSYNGEDENDKPSHMNEVLERKFYKGRFDGEISVQLYVRYIKGGCPEVVCSWEALFKFGDEDEFVQMEVSRTADGKWQFAEDLGGMELTLDDKVYTGSYASSSDKTEYEVKLVEADISIKKVEMLDDILDGRSE